MRPLSPGLEKMAREELNETPDRVQQDLIILRVWIKQQPYIRARSTDDFLLPFLRRCRYSLEETKQRLKRFLTYFNVAPELLRNRIVNERLLEINRMGVHFYPEYPKCNNNTALLITRFGNYDAKRYQFREMLQFVTMAMEIIGIENDNASIAGICQIIDCTGISFERMQTMDRFLVKKFLDWVTDCCPVRIKEIYILNPPKEVQRMVAWKRALMPWSLDIPIIARNLDELYEYIPKACLPEEYGGSNGHIRESVAYMEDVLKSYRSYFAEEANMGVCEFTRLCDLTQFETEFGLEGSFRKLFID